MESINALEHDIPFNILLADDDEDDRYFFESALIKLRLNQHYTSVDDGEELMEYLLHLEGLLPDVLFLDYNMPRKNGEECLIEIKKHPTLKDLPVIIYSTCISNEIAQKLYDLGAYFYVRKTDEKSLEKMLKEVYTLLMIKRTARPKKENFLIAY